MAEVRLDGVRKTYKEAEIVKGVSLTVQDREFLTLVGPSGCGKSTTLNMVAGLEECSQGRIFFGDQDVTDVPPERREVAMVFQSYALYPHKTVFENIAFPLRIRKEPSESVATRVKEVAAKLGLESLLDRKPAAMSGGQRQRVALARALVRPAKVFLLDEPLSNLDAKLRVYMRGELKKLHSDLRMTMIYVTHDQAEAMTLSDRVAVLHQGILQQCASPREVYDRPGNKFVAGFIGSPAMNFLDARFEKGNGGGPAVQVGDVRLPVPEAQARPAADRLGAGGAVTLGIRPEHVAVSAEARPGSFPAEVYVVEPMGHVCYVTFLLGGQRYLGTADGAFDAAPGSTVHFTIDPDRLHLFDPGTEAAIR